MTIGYKIFGNNAEKVVMSLSGEQPLLKGVNKINEDEFFVEINPTNKAVFEKLLKENNLSYKEAKLPIREYAKRFIRTHIIFIFVAIFVLVSIVSSNFFIFSISIYGLESVKEKEVLMLLEQNGYYSGRLKSRFDIENICYLIRNSNDKISFVSAVIVGNCLVINLNEKIDTSPYIYNFSPLVSPVDCIITSISYTSGAKLKNIGDTALEGEIIIAPYVMDNNKEKIPCPAKATVEAKFDLSTTFIKNEDAKIMIEKNKNMLYNKISNLNLTSEVEEKIAEFNVENVDYITISINGFFILE